MCVCVISVLCLQSTTRSPRGPGKPGAGRWTAGLLPATARLLLLLLLLLRTQNDNFALRVASARAVRLLLEGVVVIRHHEILRMRILIRSRQGSSPGLWAVSRSALFMTILKGQSIEVHRLC